MNDDKQKPNLFVRIATWIVDKRNLIFLLYVAALAFCLVSRGWVQVNNEITDYLPEDTETRIGVDLMDREFTTFGSATIMVSNITYEQAEQLADRMEEVKGVSGVSFGDTVDEETDEIDADNRTDYYRSSAALFSITFEGTKDDELSRKAVMELRDRLSGYEVAVSTEVDNDMSAELAKEMQVILVIAAVIILIVLVLTSKTYGEIPVLILTFVAAAILNMGTNYLLGEISFVSNSIAVVLQLALASDYAIIFCHRFSEEK